MVSRFMLGNIEVTAIADIDSFDVPLAFIFPGSDPGRLHHHRQWLEPQHMESGHVRLAVRSWLLRDASRTILIDTCVGNDKYRSSRPEWHQRNDRSWLKALEAAGVGPQDVDIVLCTHLHADHVGWNTRLENGRWVPTFPNARYITSEIEYHHWQEMLNGAQDPLTVGHGCLQDSVLPVVDAGQMDLVHDGRELSHGLTLDLSAGHTPGHLSLDVRRKGNRGIFCGDVLHSPIQIIEPDWSSAFCTDPGLARSTRRTLMENIADTDSLLVPAHFRGSGRCRIKSRGNGFMPVLED